MRLLLHDGCGFAPRIANRERMSGIQCCPCGDTFVVKKGMAAEVAPTAAYYREIAAEIKDFATRAQVPEVRRDLLDLAERFTRMAEFVERRYPARRTEPLP